jgi:hypothetical protein
VVVSLGMVLVIVVVDAIKMIEVEVDAEEP